MSALGRSRLFWQTPAKDGKVRSAAIRHMKMLRGARTAALRKLVNHVTEKPLFQGRKTLAMARYVYGIADPDDGQMSLL